MRFCHGHISEETGFSLGELLVVLALIGVILAATFNILTVVNRSRDAIERESQFAVEIGGPLLNMERMLMQAIEIKSFSPYSIVFVTDSDNNNLVEWHEIGIGVDGHLTQKAWLTDAGQNKTTQVLNATWSKSCTNRTKSIRFITAYDLQGNVVETPAQARAVLIDIEVVVDGHPYRDSRRLELRNYRRR